jgi:hypothetical protein
MIVYFAFVEIISSDVYNDFLDELSDYDSVYTPDDQLPRVIVVGD